MTDMSHLDKKYFIDREVYNCPFCNRNNVKYRIIHSYHFDWTSEKKCYVYFVSCSSCDNVSMHLSFERLLVYNSFGNIMEYKFDEEIEDIDSNIFYSVPTSFFVLDDRIPRLLRELITEAEGCLKMNFLTGSSACMRKAIYELLVKEEISGENYEDRIKFLKKKYPNSDAELFDILSHIQQMTSDKVHEQSWDQWDSHYLKLIIETLKTIFYDLYVLPQIKKEKTNYITQLREKVLTKKKESSSSDSKSDTD